MYCCLCWFAFVVGLFVRAAFCILCVFGLLGSVSVRIVLCFVLAFVFVAVVFVLSSCLCGFVVCDVCLMCVSW